MTSRSDERSHRRFTAVILPWLVAGGALAVYLGTLNSWVSLDSLTQVARLSGWTWQPELYGPAYWLVTYPLRWLPLKIIPLALNVFSAVCATLCLALLARSVALLPHDRTKEQRERELSRSACLSIPTAWLPPLLAVLVCGLQLSFWERATAGSSQFYTSGSNEMFDLLLFAYVIRCLLEFRVDKGDSWLIRAAFVYGVGMTNNWAMIGFSPLFLIALIWLKGFSFFDRRFLAGVALSLMAALSLYLLLPLVESLSDGALMSFWPALKINLGSQKTILHLLYRMRGQLWVLGLFSLVPILLISIRWASSFGDTSRLGVTLTKLMFYLVHGLFLVVCIWVALDPPMSPRNKGLGVPFLTFYYLGALSVGYFSGYFLLLCGAKSSVPRSTPSYVRAIRAIVPLGIWALLVLAPIALIYRNLPQIRLTNGPMFQQYAALLGQQLPAHGAIVMSDDTRRTLLLQSWAARNGKTKDYVFVDAAAKAPNGALGPLKFPEYHRFLKRSYPQGWPVLVPKGFNQPVDDDFLIQLALRLAATNSIYYLHPSFGYYFEFFYAEPHGLAYKLRPYPADALVSPPPPKELIDENINFWERADKSALKPLVAAIAPTIRPENPSLIDQLLAHAHLAKEPNHDANVVAGFYSRALDYWGVELQQLGRLTNAAALFARAVELNPDNIVAQTNLQCNIKLQAGRESTSHLSRSSVEDEFGKSRSWDAVIAENGPFAEPNFCFEEGVALVRNNMQHQAAQQFDRVKALAPNDLQARLWLAQLYVVNHLPSKALQLVTEIRAHPAVFTVPFTNRTEMLFVEASTHFSNGDSKAAQAAVESALKQYPDDQELLEIATQVYITFKSYTNALGTIEQQIKLSPTNMTALVNMGNVCIWLGKFEQAIAPLTRALMVDTNNPYALLDRGIANLRIDDLDAAQEDYERLQKVLPTNPRVNYGLQEIAYRRKDTNAAIQYCQLYLASAQTNSAEAKKIAERLKELKRSQR
jgi:tetratricopeptide (TPR) repeat protein